MEDALESEVQISPVAGPSEAGEGLLAPELLETSIREISAETKLLISRCMDGSEPLDRPLESYESLKLSTQAVNCIMLRAAGFKPVDIYKLIGVAQGTVSVYCHHPYGKKVLHALMHEQGSRVLDIKTRLEQGASKLLEHALDLALKEEDTETVAKVTFGFLDRAGFGPTQKHEVSKQTEAPSLSPNSHFLPKIFAALDQSDRINSQIMPGYKQSAPPVDTPSQTTRNLDPFADEEKAQAAGLARTGTDDA